MSIRKKPWNRTDHPVYSISSTDGKENNMHIISYVTAISMQPKRYVVGVYEGTKTLDLINKRSGFCSANSVTKTGNTSTPAGSAKRKKSK